jgi:hypothetical protein
LNNSHGIAASEFSGSDSVNAETIDLMSESRIVSGLSEVIESAAPPAPNNHAVDRCVIDHRGVR